ncbi:MAG: hypothetical protein ACI9W1_002847 [Candidatus Azotimanducaceae bacterium]
MVSFALALPRWDWSQNQDAEQYQIPWSVVHVVSPFLRACG